MRSELE